MTTRGSVRRLPSASLLFFTLSASTYTSPPISRNFLLIFAMPAWLDRDYAVSGPEVTSACGGGVLARELTRASTVI
jgi:hypothetical protein